MSKTKLSREAFIASAKRCGARRLTRQEEVERKAAAVAQRERILFARGKLLALAHLANAVEADLRSFDADVTAQLRICTYAINRADRLLNDDYNEVTSDG